MRAVLVQAILTWRLFRDPRVSVFAKLVPFAAALYAISPVDILHDIALPGIGYLDDITVVLIAMRAFLAMAPRRVVQDHLYWIRHGRRGQEPGDAQERTEGSGKGKRPWRIPIP